MVHIYSSGNPHIFGLTDSGEGWLIQCLHLSILPAIGSSPGCLCCQLSWAAGRASPLSHPTAEDLPQPPWKAPRGAYTLVLKKEGWALTSSFPWQCGIQSTTHVKDIFPLKSSINPSISSLTPVFYALNGYRIQGFWATDWIWGSLLVNSTWWMQLLRCIVVPWPTSSQTVITHMFSVLYHVSQYNVEPFPNYPLHGTFPLKTVLISCSPTSLKLSALMASADSDVTALHCMSHEVAQSLSSLSRAPHDWSEESMGCSCMILLAPTIFIASLPKSAFSMLRDSVMEATYPAP